MAFGEVEKIIWKQPHECTAREIDQFVALAAQGNEVDEADIRRGTLRAKYLLWNEKGEGFIAVAALKNPNPGYRLRVFQKASATLDISNFPFEFGYAHTDKLHQKRGHGGQLLQKAIFLAEKQGVYATARAENDGIHRLLIRAGFRRTGSNYPSERKEDEMLALFVR